MPPSALEAPSAEAFYNSLKDQGLGKRQESRLLHLRNFQNWIKATLIQECCPRPCDAVLDLACGKLGDLQKWLVARVRLYACIDIAREALALGAARLNERMPSTGVRAKMARADLGSADLSASGFLSAGERFDCISIQFALHYVFRDELTALTFFCNIRDRLNPGGVFLGTTTDADVLVRRLRDELGRADAVGEAERSGAPVTSSPDGCSFGNSVYRVTFSADAVQRQWALGGDPFGVDYRFLLSGGDKDDENVGNVTEYLVPPALLVRLAATAGLVPVVSLNFHAWAASVRDKHGDLLSRMRALDCEGTLSAEEWEAAGLYRVFAFRRAAAGEVAAAAQLSHPLPSMAEVVAARQARGDAAAGTTARLAPEACSYRDYIAPEDIAEVAEVASLLPFP